MNLNITSVLVDIIDDIYKYGSYKQSTSWKERTLHRAQSVAMS